MESATDSSSAVLRTLLVTDLVDSTKILERLGDQRAFEIFGRHDRIARDLLTEHNGREIDKTDGFLLLFDRPIDAIRYAMAYHAALAGLSRELGTELKARAGIHLGEVWVRENPPEDVARGAKPLEVEGLAKPMAARLMSLAQGGQTLLTRGAYDLGKRASVDTDFGGTTITWTSHGRYGFKGVDEPIRVFGYEVDGEAAIGPPPDTAKAWRVTRTGTPVAAARKRLPMRVGAAVALLVAVVAGWILVGGGGDADRRRTVAVLGFNNIKGDPEADWLSTALVETLNADLSASSELRTVPGEAIARTRRELGMDSVQTLAKDTLALIHRRLGAQVLVAGGYLRTAGSGALNLNLWAQDASTGEQLLSLTRQGTEDGLFDLVAATGLALREELGITAAQEAGSGLQASFPASVSGAKLYSEGLEALRAADPQRAADLLERAAALEPDSPLVHLALANAWRALGYLGRSRDAASRARELAAATANLPREQQLQVEARYAEAVGKWDTAVEGYTALFAFDPHNLFYGLRLAAAHATAHDGEAALEVVGRLRELPEPLNQDPLIDYQEARAKRSLELYDQQLEAAQRTIDKARSLRSLDLVGRAYLLRGQAFTKQGNSDEASQAYLEARKVFEETGNRARLAQSLNLLAATSLQRGEQDSAQQLFTESLELSRRIGDRRGTANALGNLAILARRAGDLETAAADLDEVITLFHEIGNRVNEAVALSNMADVRVDQGRIDDAHELYRQALTVFEEIGRQSSWANTQAAIGDLMLIQGKLAQARKHHELALARRQEIGQELKVAESTLALARVMVEEGDAGSVQTARQALAVFKDKEKRDSEALARAALAAALLAEDDRLTAELEVDRAAELAADSGNREVQRLVGLARARVALAGNDTEAARTAMRGVCPADSRTTSHICFEARVMEARIAAAEGGSKQASINLEAVESEASEAGFLLAARHAAAARSAIGG
jgi:class 3 adenylate cyclase/TolB-like protein